MQKTLYILLFSIVVFVMKGQTNLVPNPSFEDTLNCPVSSDEIYNALNWSSPTFGTPDYFNSCHASLNNAGVPYNFFGYQNAFNGNAYAGFCVYQIPNSREYLQVKLDSVMQAGADYCISYYVALTEVSGYAIKQIGLYFSDTLINIPMSTTLSFIPQIENNTFILDTNLWVKVMSSFTANGGEEYLIIGNFNNDSNTDTLGVSNNSNACCYYIDSIEVKRCLSSSIKESYNNNIKIGPNPATNYFNMDFGINIGPFNIELYDDLGQKIFSLSSINTKKLNVDISHFKTNLILIKIESYNQIFLYKLIKSQL